MSFFQGVRVIAFDADDTLWENESYFRQAERQFTLLLQPYLSADVFIQKHYDLLTKHLPYYGYGVKSFMLLSLELIGQLKDDYNIPTNVCSDFTELVFKIGHEMLTAQIDVYPHIHDLLGNLQAHYKLWVITKGDLLDQESKFSRSGLMGYFDAIHVLSFKYKVSYKKLLTDNNCNVSDFVMIGNSLKSDIEPVLSLGAKGIYMPSKTTWFHEYLDDSILEQKYPDTFLKMQDYLEFSNFFDFK